MFTPRLGVSLQVIGMPVTAELLAALAASSVRTVEIASGLFGKTRAELDELALRETLKGMGARAASVHAPFGAGLDLSSLHNDVRAAGLAAVRTAIDLAERFETDFVVVHASGEPITDEERSQRLARAISSFHSLTGRCRDCGLRIAIELLPRTCLGNTVEELLALLEELDGDVFGVCLDVNHLMERYAELPAYVRRLGGRLLTLHLSDYDGIDEKHWLPGTGVIDWEPFLQALEAIDYRGPFNYEAGIPGDTPAERLAALEMNFQMLTGR